MRHVITSCVARHYCNALRAGGAPGPLCHYCDRVERSVQLYERVFYPAQESASDVAWQGPEQTAGDKVR